MTEVDLLRITRARLTSVLATTKTAAEHAALLVDKAMLRVLSRGVRMSELLDGLPHITLVDLVTSEREMRAPIGLAKSMDVIYLLEPKLESVKNALDDHGPGQTPIYGGSVHFIFSRAVSDELMELIRQSPALSRVSTLREVNLQFLPLRHNVFSLDAPSALNALYGPMDASSRNEAFATLAAQVKTACLSLASSYAPRVRYCARSHPTCRAFAEALESTLCDAAASLHVSAAEQSKSSRRSIAPDGGPQTERRRGTLLVLDRSFDPVTPLLYDFSFEALAEGLGVLKGGRFTPTSTAKGSEESASSTPQPEVLLLESDPVWSDLRYLPFEQVPEALSKHTQRFLSEHETIVRAQRQDAGMSLAQRHEASRAQFAFTFRKRHEQLKIQEELVRAVTQLLLHDSERRTPLFEQLNFEQDLATGRQVEGGELRQQSALSRVVKELERLSQTRDGQASDPLARQAPSSTTPAHNHDKPDGQQAPAAAPAVARVQVSEVDNAPELELERSLGERCRLLTLFSTCRQPSDEELADALRAAALPPDAHLTVARSLMYMGVPLSSRRLRTPPGIEADVPLSRHIPRLRKLLEDALAGLLSDDDFPFADGGPSDHDAADPFGSPGGTLPSPRSELVGSWAFQHQNRENTPARSPQRTGAAGSHMFTVLIMGGACHAELRVAQEASGNLIFGCSSLHTPLQYLHTLQQLGHNDFAPQSMARSLLTF